MALQMDKYTAIAVGSERGGTASDRHSSRQNLEPSHQGQVERLIFYRSSSPTRNQIHNSINSFNILFRMEGCGFNHCQNYAGTVRKKSWLGSIRLRSTRGRLGFWPSRLLLTGLFQSAAGGVPVWASIDSCSACETGVFSGRRQM